MEDLGTIQGKEETKNYELKIAYNPCEEISYHKLFSFFRTEVDFPYPVIAHGSFELKSDRNHLIRDKNNFNIELISKLAKLLVDCALKLTEGDISSYNALKLLIPKDYQHSSLYEDPWNLDDLIKDYINKTPIFPTITEKYITLSDNPKFYPVQLDHLIPKNHAFFQSFLKSTNDEHIINYLFDEYEGLEYPEKDFTEVLNELIEESWYSREEKVDWIEILSGDPGLFYEEDEPVLPNFLENSLGETIKTDKDDIILPPKGKEYDLPANLELQFINRDLTEKLKNKIEGDIRDLSTRLRIFNVDEYSMTVVARKIISGANKMIQMQGSNHLEVIYEMHRTLFSIYNSIVDETEKTYFFQNLPSPLLFTRHGKLKKANTLYFGEEYNLGFLSEKLVGPLKKDVFLAPLEKLGFEKLAVNGKSQKIEEYLKWIGVAEMPRSKALSYESIPRKIEYVNHIFDHLSFPYSLPYDSKTFQTRNDIDKTYGYKVKVLWYEFFEDILKNVSFEYILAWFIRDREIYNCIVSDEESDESEFRMLFDNNRNLRSIDNSSIRSYIGFYLQDLNFVPVNNGEFAKPTECVINSTNLSPLVQTPEINYDSEVFNFYKIKEDQIAILLNRLGLQDSFKDLPIKIMYSLLNNHYKVFNKDSNSSSTLYSAIIDATLNTPKDFDWDFDQKLQFLENGRILCTVNGQNEFVRIQEATYVLNPNHSQDLLDKLKVAKIRQRVGNTRIRELFGIQPIDHINFNVRDSKIQNFINNEFQRELNLLKPLLFAYRYQKNLTKKQYRRELLSLKELKINLCTELEIEYSLNKNSHSLDLHTNEYVYEKKSNSYYIKIDYNILSYSKLKQTYRFVETVADIICGALTVTENRKDFMLLIGQPQTKWNEIMSREFADYPEIEQNISKSFGGTLNSKQQFWKDVINATGKIDYTIENFTDEKEIFELVKDVFSWDEFFEFYRKIDYLNLSTKTNFELFQELYKRLQIDTKDYNLVSKNDLNFNECYLEILNGIHSSYRKKYNSFLYSKGFSDNFILEIEKFESIPLEDIYIPNSLFVDPFKIYEEYIANEKGICLDELKAENLIDIENTYKLSLKSLKNLIREENILDNDLLLALQYENDFKNKLYFSLVKDAFSKYKNRYLKGDVKRGIVRLKPGGDEININEDEELIAAIEKNVSESDFEVEYYDPQRISTKPKVNNDKKGKSKQSRFGIKPTIPNSDIGFIGEKYAFEILKKNYDEVHWVSEYAIRAGLPKGSDGLGYDFECLKNGEKRLIEVKSSTTLKKSFYISNKEISTGHSNSSKYDIFLVSNLLSENISFKYLKNVFLYPDGETFFSTKSFLVQTDGYQIKFK